jgi:hypothetical protein
VPHFIFVIFKEQKKVFVVLTLRCICHFLREHTLSSHISLSLSNIARSIQLCVDCCRQRSDSNSCSRSSYKLIPYFLHFSYICHSFFKILKLYKTSLQFILIQNELNLHFLFVQNFSKTNSP